MWSCFVIGKNPEFLLPTAGHQAGKARRVCMQSVTLNENRDFRRAYAKGKSRVHRLLVTYVLRNRLGVNGWFHCHPKKSAKPADCNRARRVIREAYRILEPQLRQGYDIVFVARGATGEVKCRKSWL